MAREVTEFDKQELAELFAIGGAPEELAWACGTTLRTVYRRLKDPEVRRIAAEIRAANLAGVSGLLQTRSRLCAERVMGLVDSADERIALAAARLHHDMMKDAIDLEEMRSEMRQLRAEVDELKGLKGAATGGAPPATTEVTA